MEDAAAAAAPAEASDSDTDGASEASEPDSSLSEDSEADMVEAAPSSRQTGKQRAVHQQQQQQQQQHDAQAELQEYASVQERREEMKQQLAVTASKILQNPEAHLPTLKSLLALAADKDVQVTSQASMCCQSVITMCPAHMQWVCTIGTNTDTVI